MESRFEATRGANPRALVGRVHELGILTERWAIARQGRGQAVQIVGEAGIGKSRLVEAFLEQLDIEPAETSSAFSARRYHTNSSLYPVIERLRRLAGFAPDDNAGRQSLQAGRLVADVHDDVSRRCCRCLPSCSRSMSDPPTPGSTCRRPS